MMPPEDPSEYIPQESDDHEGRNRPWVEGGNSDKQQEARCQARLKLRATP